MHVFLKELNRLELVDIGELEVDVAPADPRPEALLHGKPHAEYDDSEAPGHLYDGHGH